MILEGRAEPAAGDPSLEHQVKIAFIYNFAKFLEWPPEAFASASEPVTLGILGDDPFCRALERVLHDKKVNARTLVVRRFRSVEQIQPTSILFVGAALEKDVPRILAAVRGRPVLTVGDAGTFARHGGVINFTMEDHKVRFEVNLDAAERAGLRISSKLLRVAKVIRDTPEARSR